MISRITRHGFPAANIRSSIKRGQAARDSLEALARTAVNTWCLSSDIR